MVEKYGNKFLISKQILLVCGLIAVAACVVTGLVVYYAGVANIKDGEVIPGESSGDAPVLPPKQKVTDVRLPRHLMPQKYKLKLVPFIVYGNFSIKGHVEITMVCTSSARNVTFHSADIDIHNETVQLLDQQGNKIHIQSRQVDSDREFFILNLGTHLQPGQSYKLIIGFTAKLNDNLKGFYRSEYTDLDTGVKEYTAVTQFQPTDARRAFPCFDEPALKAIFEVSLGRTRNMSSISNMPIRVKGEEMSEDPDYVWDHYEESVKMSTYLVAFVVSKFGYKENTLSNNVRFRIWSTKFSLDQTELARELGPKILQFFEEYFKVKFPLPKQDMVAIPDFAAGAMENWGLITYRETALLFKEGVSAVANRERIATVISHELAHQWFGNLVTPSWWTDLWLNEGFASYVEYLGVDAVVPEMKLLEQFVIMDLQDVLRVDALESSHPISIPVKHPDEINEIFDRISYGKGASIIRMMDNFLTTKTFRQGLTNYLEEKKFDAATQNDLWDHLTQQGHRDGTLPPSVSVKEVMDTWTLKMGFPVVNVKRQYESNTATVQQERFLLKSGGEEGTPYSWWIPITFTHPGGDFNNTYNNHWLAQGEREKSISGMPDSTTPVIFNVQETGYYRVNYDIKNWQLLAASLNRDHNNIHIINRAQILDDCFNLAKVGRVDYATALSMTGYLNKETEYVPWQAAFSGLSYIKTMLTRTSAYGDFKRYMLSLLDPIYSKIGFHAKPEDKHLDILLRSHVVRWACSMGHQDCLEQAKTKFSDWMLLEKPDMDGANPIDVNIKSEIYCYAIMSGGEKEWDFAWNRYMNSSVASEKSKLLSALGCTREIWLLNRFLTMSLNATSGIRKQDGSYVIGGVAKNPVGRYLAFDFVRDNWDTISDYFSGMSSISRVFKYLGRDFNTRIQLTQLKDFEARHKSNLGTSARVVQQAIENGDANVKWMEDNYELVWNWLKKHNK